MSSVLKFPEGLPKFEPRPLTKRELRKAMETDKESYPFSTTCALCDQIWGSHLGLLCPAGSEASQNAAKEFHRVLMEATATGHVPDSAYQRDFHWRGTLFVPLLDTSEVAAVHFDMGNLKA